tara:strand:+ start:274 stop:492 length:219 start_codon:yes stop_codon:yes gene_type:complete
MKATELLATGNGEDVLKAVNLIIQESITGEISFVAGAQMEDSERAHACGRLDALINLKSILDEKVNEAKRNR